MLRVRRRCMSKHFADEAQHAWYWTSCIEQLGVKPLDIGSVYQDQYAAVAGLPSNLMDEYVKHCGLRRVSTLREVADLMAWLALRNTYITGQTILVDGAL